MSYKVRLSMFEGPFDLLVYLIENARMSIYDIRISEITSQYLEYMENMKKRNVSISAEFMVLAAELIEIKFRMMLPKVDVCTDATDVEDPRSQLAERLLAYKRCKRQRSLRCGGRALPVPRQGGERGRIGLDDGLQTLAGQIDAHGQAL